VVDPEALLLDPGTLLDQAAVFLTAVSIGHQCLAAESFPKSFPQSKRAP
jgi:hypothetical protein